MPPFSLGVWKLKFLVCISCYRAKWSQFVTATLANAFCIDGVNICTEVIVPKSSSQDLYIQIKAPDTSGWAGVGIGSGMTGALIFVVYPDAAKTNLTLSPRLGMYDYLQSGLEHQTNTPG